MSTVTALPIRPISELVRREIMEAASHSAELGRRGLGMMVDRSSVALCDLATGAELVQLSPGRALDIALGLDPVESFLPLAA